MSTLADFGADVPEEPWKDAEILEGVYEGRTQKEMAELFRGRGHDVTASTISYWMNKLEINTSHTNHDDEEQETRACMNWDECGNQTPGPNNYICDTCLDEARYAEDQP